MTLCPPTFQAEILFILTIMQKSASRKKMRPSSMYFSCYCFSWLPNWGHSPKLLRNSQCEEWCIHKRSKKPTSKKSQVVTSRKKWQFRFWTKASWIDGIWVWLQNNKTTWVIVKSILSQAPTTLTSIYIIFQALTITCLNHGPLANFSIFSILGKMLSYLLRDDNIFARNENIGKICKQTITWTDFSI